MLERERGRVLNVGTRAASVLLPNLGLYGITKLAGERTIEFLDFEWSGRGVSFNTFRIDKIIPTDAYRLSLERQGEGIAKGCLLYTSASVSSADRRSEWMVISCGPPR